ncbi:MAG: hypothetical protein LDL38_09835 [Flavobacterium piscis]|jgi:hypothetical protein|uniref:hypothetical protein n=1 Tax=Flavobacterium sp. KBS0721 TaxID=1179672 RepID=UPI00098EFA5A|nr:hypothetical protein [Flavobacterium sp. KBS0721]MCA1919688.1 hypothetical protein [Flavobacterium piscis]QDW22318.1 hypothetical protein B0M43_0020065 [Flavobacterium sp. KBS0721]
MEKERVLVCDNKGIFLKMFKRRFKNEFDFFENSFLSKNENEAAKFDRSIYVVYDKSELVEFLQLEKKGTNVLVCLFNKQLYDSLSFLQEVKSLILLDSSKTRIEIIKELQSHFKNKSDLVPETSEMKFAASNIMSIKFNNFYKALFFLM